MRIRTIILAASIPLLILLAAANGVLLYYQSKAEMQRGLEDRARAAAVVGAEFLTARGGGDGVLRSPARRAALAAAVRHVEGLEGYYWVDAAGKSAALAPPRGDWHPGRVPPAAAVEVRPLARDAEGRRFIVARARVAGGGFVAARLDAGPLFTQLDELLGWIVAGVVAAGGIGLAAGWHVARRIERELAVDRRVIAALDAGQPLPDTEGLTLAETSDLAAALRLLDANRRAALAGLARRQAREDGERTERTSLAEWRGALFAPLETEAAGARVAMRLCGDAPAGSFFALARDGERAAAVVGVCEGETPLDALAMAVAARRFAERHWHSLGAEEALALMRGAFGAAAVRYLAWSDAAPLPQPTLLAAADDESEGSAAIYVRAVADASPGERLNGIAALLEPDGVFAIVAPA